MIASGVKFPTPDPAPPWEAAEKGPCAQAPGTHKGDPDGAAGPAPALVGTGDSECMQDFSLSLCLSNQ